MGLLESLVLGSYVYTTWLFREVWKLRNNHLRHQGEDIAALARRVSALEDK